MDTSAETQTWHYGVVARWWAEFNTEMSRLEANEVRRRHPDYDDDRVLRALVRRRYGDELARAAWPGLELVEP